MDKIPLDKLKELCGPDVGALSKTIKVLAEEKGVDLTEGWVREIFMDVIENIHVKKFITNKARKVGMWVKRKLTWKNLFG